MFLLGEVIETGDPPQEGEVFYFEYLQTHIGITFGDLAD
jgi:hypothetical protein